MNFLLHSQLLKWRIFCCILNFLLHSQSDAAIGWTLFQTFPDFFMMKMSDVEATGSGGSRAEDSEARPQVAGYGARPGGRPRRPGRAKPQRHVLR